MIADTDERSDISVTAGSGIGSDPYTPYANGGYAGTTPTTGGAIPVPQTAPGGYTYSQTGGYTVGSTGIAPSGPIGGGTRIENYFANLLNDAPATSNETEHSGYDGTSGMIELPAYQASSGNAIPSSDTQSSYLANIMGSLGSLLAGTPKTSNPGGIIATQVPVAVNPSSSGGGSNMPKIFLLLAIAGLGFYGYKKGWFSKLAPTG